MHPFSSFFSSCCLLRVVMNFLPWAVVAMTSLCCPGHECALSTPTQVRPRVLWRHALALCTVRASPSLLFAGRGSKSPFPLRCYHLEAGDRLPQDAVSQHGCRHVTASMLPLNCVVRQLVLFGILTLTPANCGHPRAFM